MAVPIIRLLVEKTRQFPGGFQAGVLVGRPGLLGRGFGGHRCGRLDWRLVLDRFGLNVQFGKEHRIGGGVAGKHHPHERRKVAICCGQAGGENPADQVIIKTRAVNDLTHTVLNLAGIHVDFEAAEQQAVVSSADHLCHQRPDFRIPGRDGVGHPDLQQLLAVADLESAAVDGALAGDEKLHGLFRGIAVEKEFVRFEVADQGSEC